MSMKQIDVELFKKVCEESLTMAIAASALGMRFTTFKRWAKKLEIYKPNPGGKGTKKNSNEARTIPLKEIIEGKHPSYQTNKLRKRLLAEGLFQNKCSCCGIEEWNGRKITCELDHTNGVKNDHRIINLRLLCPNCHSQTSTFRGKNKKKAKKH